MLLEFLCNIFFALCRLLLSLFPRFPSFDQLNVSLAPVFYVVRFVNMFVSVPVLARCLTVVLLVYNIKFVWSIFMWLVRKIPGVS